MDFEKSSIERLKRTLYSRNDKIVPKEKRTPVSEKKNDVPEDWGTASNFTNLDNPMVKKNNKFFNRFLLGSFVFFLVALTVAAFIFFGGMNMISSDNLDIKITAPSSASSGEELMLGLSVVNGNRTDLEQVSLFVDYPQGALSVRENKPLSREKIDMGIIPSGETKEHTVRVVLSGEKEAVKTFNFRIEYKVAGSNAVFSKDKTYDVVISSSPLILNLSYPKEMNSGSEVTLTIDVISNSSVVIKDSLVKIEYPYGFTYKSSNLKPVEAISSQSTDSVWSLGDLKNGDKKTLLLLGTLVGQNLEDRSFKVSAGTQKSSTIQDFDLALATNIATIGIRKSLFDLAVTSNGISSLGRPTLVNIRWQNILPDKIINTRIVATISGNVFDKAGVRVNDGGFFRSTDNTIVWDKNSTQTLENISPGDSDSVSFLVSSLSNSVQTALIKNPHIDIVVKSTGSRSGIESGEVVADQGMTIKFPSIFTFSAKSYRGVGPFSNSGSIPPQADKESTYTITWTITNTSNDLKNVIATATLPAGIEWKNETSPLGERISYNSETRTINWNVGNVSFGTGYTYSPKEVSFKVGITPNVTQIGSVPDLITKVRAEGMDTYTETSLSADSGAVNIRFSDPSFKNSDGIVVK